MKEARKGTGSGSSYRRERGNNGGGEVKCPPQVLAAPPFVLYKGRLRTSYIYHYYCAIQLQFCIKQTSQNPNKHWGNLEKRNTKRKCLSFNLIYGSKGLQMIKSVEQSHDRKQSQHLAFLLFSFIIYFWKGVYGKHRTDIFRDLVVQRVFLI